jgi:hypothetical protein
MRWNGSSNGSKLFIIVLAVLAMLSMGAVLKMEKKGAEQKVLMYQLLSLRTSLNLFKSVMSRNPSDLKELGTAVFKFPGDADDRRFLNGPVLDAKGAVLDPFGNPYDYDPKTGWVRSTTPGYTYW